MASARPYRRRQLIVDRSFQFRFVGVLLAVLCVLTVAALAGVYFALWMTLYTFELLHDPVSVSLFTTVGLLVALELLVIAPFVAWLGIVLTHKVAGPLVRIQAALSQMTEGKFDIHITLRKGDALVELAEAINRLAAYLRSRSSSGPS